MIVRHHVRSPKPETLTLTANPLTIWLSRAIELVVEPGDTLAEVVVESRKYWKHLSDPEAYQLVACWFAMGERRAGKRPTNCPWTDAERDITPTRRYLHVLRAEQPHA